MSTLPLAPTPRGRAAATCTELLVGLALLLTLLPNHASATGGSELLEAYFMILVLGPLGALMCVVTLVLGLSMRSRGVPGGRLERAVRVAGGLTMGLGVASIIAGLGLRLNSSMWLDWQIIYIVLGFIPVGVGLLARKLRRNARGMAESGEHPSLRADS